MNIQLSLADFYRIGLEKNYEFGISTTISNDAKDSPQIVKKQRPSTSPNVRAKKVVPKPPLQASISGNANNNSIKTMDSRQISQKQVVPDSPAQASLSGDLILNKTIGKSRNSQEIIAKPQQEVNKTPKKLFETPVQAPPPIGNWNRTFSSSMDSAEEIAKQQEKAYTIRCNKSVASLDALNNLKQVLQSPPVQAIPLPRAAPKGKQTF